MPSVGKASIPPFLPSPPGGEGGAPGNSGPGSGWQADGVGAPGQGAGHTRPREDTFELRTGSNPASWVVPRAPSCRPSHKPKAERSGQLGETGPPRTLSRRAHPPPGSKVGGGGTGEATSPETWMVCCLSSPGLPARVSDSPLPLAQE